MLRMQPISLYPNEEGHPVRPIPRALAQVLSRAKAAVDSIEVLEDEAKGVEVVRQKVVMAQGSQKAGRLVQRGLQLNFKWRKHGQTARRKNMGILYSLVWGAGSPLMEQKAEPAVAQSLSFPFLCEACYCVLCTPILLVLSARVPMRSSCIVKFLS